MRPVTRLVFVLASGLVLGGCERRTSAAIEREASAPVVIASTPAPEPPVASPPPRDAGRRLRELPLGGRELFPAHRLVGFCGTPGAPKLGRLAGNLGARAKTIETYAKEYAGDRTPLLVFELIAVVVQEDAGPDGKHRRRVSDEVVDKYMRAAREAKGLLLVNIQPGRSDFLTEVKHFERWLREPDVGVALDPEWAMVGKEQPGAKFGQTSGDAINEVASWLGALVAEEELPEKALVFHQVNDRVLRDESVLKAVPGVVLVKSVDGLGPRANKIRTYDHLVKSLQPGVRAGFKLFFEEDTRGNARLMTPQQVLALEPTPDYVMYE